MVSIIIPIYNAEKYLQATIDSVFMQTFLDWELILVDDGSTDASPQICELAGNQSDRVRVLHNRNAGVSAARNCGLDMAQGSNIMFLDADDLLPPETLSVLTGYADKDNADIVCGGIKEIGEDYEMKASGQSTTAESKSFHSTCYSPQSATLQILYQKNIDCSACGKLYRTSLWRDQRFREGMRYEDLDLIPRLFTMAERITHVDNITYLYRQHPTSYIHTFSLKRADVLDVTSQLTEWMTDRDDALGKGARARELNANFNILGLIAANFKDASDEKSGIKENEKIKAMLLADRCWNKIKELRGEALRNPSVRLKTKLGILASYIGGRSLLEKFSKIIYAG